MHALNGLRIKLSRLMGIDRAVFFAILSKVWSMVAGIVTTLMIAYNFSVEIQGYYYTFFSVLALQVFAELGLGVVISANASHEWAKLSLNSVGQVVGDPDAKSKLTSLGRFALRWYAVAGIVATLGLMFGGMAFFGSTDWKSISTWGAPWALLCIVTGINICCMPILVMLEGCNQVTNVFKYRFIQSITTSLASWIAIYLGAGLWVAPIAGLVTLGVLTLTIGKNYIVFIKEIMLSHPLGPRLDWQKDILPMQWRISVSWMSGYLTFSLFTPVLFHYQGVTTAGQMGMTWSIVNSLTSVAASWIATTAPVFAILISQKRFADLDKLFWRLSVTVVIITTLGAAIIWLIINYLNILQHPYANRLLSPTATAYLLVSTILLVASLPMSTYLRAHKKEPLMALSLISGVATGLIVYFMGRYYSSDGMVIGYFIVMIFVFILVLLIWSNYRKTWHAPIKNSIITT
jgi:O-antigen/teichoic acid export membrane protein